MMNSSLSKGEQLSALFLCLVEGLYSRSVEISLTVLTYNIDNSQLLEKLTQDFACTGFPYQRRLYIGGNKLHIDPIFISHGWNKFPYSVLQNEFQV